MATRRSSGTMSRRISSRLLFKFGGHHRDTGHVAARMRQAVGKPRGNRVTAEDIDYGYGEVEFADFGNGRALDNEKLYACAHQFRGKLRHAIERIIAEAVLDDEVAPLDIAKFGKTLAHSREVWREACFLLRRQPPDLD